MGRYYYIPDETPGQSGAWRLGNFEPGKYELGGTKVSLAEKKRVVAEQNDSLVKFFYKKKIQELVEKEDWWEVFYEWGKLRKGWHPEVLACFLLKEAKIDFLEDLSEEEQLQLLTRFNLQYKYKD